MTGIFQRKEQKYLITDRQRAAVEAVLADHMREDEHGESTIRNIYFDTVTGLLIRRSDEKPVYKEKLRLRSYRQLEPEQDAFLELKKKYRGIVYKRRIEVREDAFFEYLDGKQPFPAEGQIAREIEYCCRFYKDLRSRMFLSYDRCALYGKEDPELRITFDRNIRWRTDRLSLAEEADGEELLEEGQSLMEIKAEGGMPLWLVDVLTENRIRRISFSKYGTAYRQYTEMKGSIRYA